MQFDFGGEMDYYMPRFFESRSRDLLVKLVDPALHWSTPCRVHDYWLVDPPAVVSLANFQA